MIRFIQWPIFHILARVPKNNIKIYGVQCSVIQRYGVLYCDIVQYRYMGCSAV